MYVNFIEAEETYVATFCTQTIGYPSEVEE